MEDLFKKTVIAAGITASIYLILFIFFDKSIDLWIHNNYANTWLYQSGEDISSLAKGAYIKFGLALSFIVILIVDPNIKNRRTKQLLYVCVSVSVAIIIADGMKYFLGRYRPIMLFKHNLYGLHFFSSEGALNSTPSGHTVRAFSLLTAVSLLYRRFTVLFISVAALIGASRVAVTAHYPSDVLFGAFLGIFTALWTYKYFFSQGNKGAEQFPD